MGATDAFSNLIWFHCCHYLGPSDSNFQILNSTSQRSHFLFCLLPFYLLINWAIKQWTLTIQCAWCYCYHWYRLECGHLTHIVHRYCSFKRLECFMEMRPIINWARLKMNSGAVSLFTFPQICETKFNDHITHMHIQNTLKSFNHSTHHLDTQE